jgi:Na+/proline symporter
VSAALNSLSSATVVDFFGGKRDQQKMGLARGFTVFWALVLIAIGLVARHWGSVLESGLSIASVTLGILLGVFMLGVLTKRVGESAAIAGVIVGLGVILYVKLATHIAFTWWVPIGACSTFITACAASFIWPMASMPIETGTQAQ